MIHFCNIMIFQSCDISLNVAFYITWFRVTLSTANENMYITTNNNFIDKVYERRIPYVSWCQSVFVEFSRYFHKAFQNQYFPNHWCVTASQQILQNWNWKNETCFKSNWTTVAWYEKRLKHAEFYQWKAALWWWSFIIIWCPCELGRGKQECILVN